MPPCIAAGKNRDDRNCYSGIMTPACNSEAGSATELFAANGRSSVSNTPKAKVAARTSTKSGLRFTSLFPLILRVLFKENKLSHAQHTIIFFAFILSGESYISTEQKKTPVGLISQRFPPHSEPPPRYNWYARLSVSSEKGKLIRSNTCSSCRRSVLPT
jgi:hypothetical protein